MTAIGIEELLFHHLITNEEYLRKVIPYVKKEYFHDPAQARIFTFIDQFWQKYGKCPTVPAIAITVQQSNITEQEYERVMETLEALEGMSDDTPLQYLIDQTEQFCKDRAGYNALVKGSAILSGENKDQTVGDIVELFRDVASITFDTQVGHDYRNDAESRYDDRDDGKDRIPFRLNLMNKITNGGIPRGTLSICMAETGKGKSIWLCDHAAWSLLKGYNVLYISLELSEDKIAERIDANMLDIELNELYKMEKSQFLSKFNTLNKKLQGQLYIKTYPAGSAHAGHFRALINELNLKKGFVPDVICVDYIGICASSRVKLSTVNGNTNAYGKAVAEELRALAQETDTQMHSGVQVNRDGYDNSDIDLTNTAQAISLPETSDFFFVLIGNEQMDSMKQILIKQLKNRFGDLNYYRSFAVGLDRAKMQFYDLDEDLEWTPEEQKQQEEFEESALDSIYSSKDRRMNFSDFVFD